MWRPSDALSSQHLTKIKLCRCNSRNLAIPTAKLPLTQIHSKTLKILVQHIPHHFPCLLLQIGNLCLSKDRRLFHLCPGFQHPCYHSVEARRCWLSVGKTTITSGCLLLQVLVHVLQLSHCSIQIHLHINFHFQIFSLRRPMRSIFKSSMVLNRAFQWHQYVSDAKLCRIPSHPSHQLTFCTGSPSVTWRRRASTSSARLVTCKCKKTNYENHGGPLIHKRHK